MRKWLSFLLLSCGVVQAQQPIGDMVATELHFSAYAGAHGTKSAFLKFADTNAVAFENARPVNAIESWNKRDDRPGILKWFPTYAEVSSSLDFGFTTGPWTFQPTLSDSVVARGQFITVWNKKKDGEWKFMIDLGVSKQFPQDTILVKSLPSEKVKAGSLQNLYEAEQKFIADFKSTGVKAYDKFLSQRSLLFRNSVSAAVKFSMIDGKISSAGDLGFVYGSTDLDGKKENYLHIWRKEITGWKLALEVLRY